MKKNKFAIGLMATGIFVLGVSVGIVMSKQVNKKGGAVL